MPRVRPYTFYDTAVSICSTCYVRVDAKIVFEDDRVFMLKRCPEHGLERVLLSIDVDYYRRAREVFLKPPEQPLHYNSPLRWGCPYDCGICPDHEQHSCITVVEICDACNLECPICYAQSGPTRQKYRTVEQIEVMLDAIVRNEGEPDVVQISGGEPTIHPQLFEILDAARARPIRHLMLNTNGIELAQKPELAHRLAQYSPGFEIYLQFDSLEESALRDLRGADLRRIRRDALRNCEDAGLDVSLVVTVKKGVNDHELGAIVDFALTQKCVRGVTFQPVQIAGRLQGFDPARDRLTLSEVRRSLVDQSSVFAAEDIIPVPCHADSIAMGYALKLETGVYPLTGIVPDDVWIGGARNTIMFEREPGVREAVNACFSTGNTPTEQADHLRDLLCCLPHVDAPAHLEYANVFRVIILEFIDAYSFDLRSIRKTCVSIAHPDGRIIPFDTYNLFYRDELEAERLAPIRAQMRRYS